MIEVRSLQKTYRSHGAAVGLLGADFLVPDGQIVGILGENGAGKTTMLRCIAGLLPHKGTALLDGQPAGDIVPYEDVIVPFTSELQAGGVDLSGLDVVRTGEAHWIEESYVIDRHGIVSFTITDLETGYRQTHQLGVNRDQLVLAE